MIYFNKVSKIYPKGSPALEDIDLTITAGEFVSIVGHSGAGKRHSLNLADAHFPNQVRLVAKNPAGVNDELDAPTGDRAPAVAHLKQYFVPG